MSETKIQTIADGTQLKSDLEKTLKIKYVTKQITTDAYGQFTIADIDPTHVLDIVAQNYKYYIVRYSTNYVLMARVTGSNVSNQTITVGINYY